MIRRISLLSRFPICAAAVLTMVSAGCAHTGNGYDGPPTAGPKIEPVELAALPLEAQPLEIGSIGIAYRIENAETSTVRIPVSGETTAMLLPSTIRLFRFDDRSRQWNEIAESRFEAKSSELVGTDLKPGLYTAFGWSANPVENVLQRLLVDAALGYGSLTEIPELRPQPAQSVAVPEVRRAAVRAWLVASFTYPITSCTTFGNPGCPPECGDSSRRRTVLRSCRIQNTEPPGGSIFCDPDRDPPCCNCVTGSWTERLVVPRDFLEVPPVFCRGVPPGSLCPTCPRGLSCPSGPFTDLQQIEPTLEVPDYTVLERFGLGAITEDTVLREELHNLVEEVTGNRYPVPPPWP